MRVAVLRSDCFPGISGAARMAERLAAELVERGHDVTLLTTDPPESLDPAICGAARVVSLPRWSASAMADAVGEVDVVHAIDLARVDHGAAGAALAGVCGAAFVVTPATAAALWEHADAALALCRLANAVHVLTGAEQRSLQRAGIAADVFVATGQGAALVGRPDPAGLRRALGADGPLVLFLGRKLRTKGVLTLLAAAPAVWEEVPRTRFLFAGPPGDLDCGEALARCDDARVTDLGLLDEPSKHSALAACDALCLPTTADVAPLAVVEAWTCGAPVVTGRYDGVEDVIQDGVNGLVADVAPHAVAEALVRVLTDPALARRLREGGAQAVRARHDWGHVVDALEQAYGAVLARCGAAA